VDTGLTLLQYPTVIWFRFNRATAFQPWIRKLLPVAPNRYRLCFNRATAFQPWILRKQIEELQAANKLQ